MRMLKVLVWVYTFAAITLAVVLIMDAAGHSLDGDTLVVGDSLAAAVPGFAGDAERMVTYHVADSILALQEVGRYHTIVIELGVHATHGSDRLYATNPWLFRRRYGQLLDTALEHGDNVIAVNIPWLDWDREHAGRAQALNDIIAEEAAARGVTLVDAYTPMERCALACIAGDGFHPNGRGYGVIAAAVGEK